MRGELRETISSGKGRRGKDAKTMRSCVVRSANDLEGAKAAFCWTDRRFLDIDTQHSSANRQSERAWQPDKGLNGAK